MNKFRYQVPIINTKFGANASWMAIEGEMYPSKVSPKVPSSYTNMSVLVSRIEKFAEDMTLESFCVKFGYKGREDFVLIVAKYMGICFDDSSYTTAEDYLIRFLYFLYGNQANLAVKIALESLELDYVPIRTEREIQDRVDYLQSGKNFSKKYNKCLPRGIKVSGDILTSGVGGINRTPYTSGEVCLLKMSYRFGVDFLPWKEAKEKDFYYRHFVQNDSYRHENLYANERELRIDFTQRRTAIYNALMDSYEVKFASSSWSSKEDEILRQVFDSWNAQTEVSSKQELYAPLINRGKTVEDCEKRRPELRIKVPYTISEIIGFTNAKDMTSAERATRISVINRSVYSVALKTSQMENAVGKPIHLWNRDDKMNYLMEKGQA